MPCGLFQAKFNIRSVNAPPRYGADGLPQGLNSAESLEDSARNGLQFLVSDLICAGALALDPLTTRLRKGCIYSTACDGSEA